MIGTSSGHLKVEPPATVAAMLRMWLRRRRLLVASVALTIVLVPSLLFMVNINATYVLSPADYDTYDYDAVDGVHALVHEMSHTKARRDVIGIRFLRSPKHIRTQSAHHTYDDEDEEDEGARGGAFPRTGSLKSRRPVGGSRKGIFRRKIQDSEDVPPEDVKGYAFLHKNLPGLTTKALPPLSDNMGKEGAADDEIYHANEDEDDYGVGDKEENPQEAMFEPRPGDEEDKQDEYLENDETEYDYWSRNKEFKIGDFDAMPKNQRKPVLKYEDLPNEDSEAEAQRPLDSLVRALGADERVMALKEASTRHPQDGHPLVKDNAHQKQQQPRVVESSLNYKQQGKDSKLRFVPNCDQTQTTGCKPVTSNRERTIKMPSKTRKALMRGGENEIQSPQKKQQQQNQQQQYRQQSIPRLDSTPTNLRDPKNSNSALSANRLAVTNRSLEASLMSSKTIVEYAHHLPLHEQPATQLQVPELPPQQGEVVSRAGHKVVSNRIYWAPQVERFVTPGITAENVAAFREKVGRLQVSEMREPQWNRCGRPKNQYVLLEDGSALCARYRAPHTKMIQGEILSFYLARLLGVDSVPVSVLAEVNSSAPQWSRVTPARAGWEDGQVVVFIQWIEGLDKIWSQVKMPTLILSAYQRGVPVDRNHPALPTMSPSELSELLQWSDMILFDYIIGHYDRVASMQDGAEREQKASIMSESIRNLRKVPSTNKLWFVDNESGLFDGYELMKYGRKNGPRFVRFHEQMLQTMCLFRQSLVENIEQLARHSDPQEVLTQFTAAHEPLYTKLPSVSKVKYFKQFFHTRLKEVVAWVEKCRAS